MPTTPRESAVLSEIEREEELPPSVALTDADTGGQAVPQYVLDLVSELEEIDRRLTELYQQEVGRLPAAAPSRLSAEAARRRYEARELERRRREILRLVQQFLPLLPPELRYIVPYEHY